MTGRHVDSLNDEEAVVAVRAYAALAAVLKIQTITKASVETVRLADLAARLSSRYQRHSTGLCNCPLPPVLGGTHS